VREQKGRNTSLQKAVRTQLRVKTDWLVHQLVRLVRLPLYKRTVREGWFSYLFIWKGAKWSRKAQNCRSVTKRQAPATWIGFALLGKIAQCE
jgi:hypothetical protein